MNNFVFHEEYIMDIPSDRLAEFEHYIINYGLFNQIPDLKGFEKTFWNTIQRRIDADKIFYEETCLKRKINAIKGRINNNKASENDYKNLDDYNRKLNELNEVKRDSSFKTDLNELNEVKLTHYDTDLKSDSDTDLKYDTDIDSDIEQKMPVAASPATQNYSKIIFNLFKDAGLPCARNNEISFLQTDFANGMRYLHTTQEYAHIHSDDVIGAVKNYIEVLKSSKTYFTAEMNFFKFVQSKKFYDFLPANYNFNNFLKFDEKEGAEEKKPEKKIFYKLCPKCNQMKVHTVQDGNLTHYECDNCHAVYQFGELKCQK